MPIFLPLVHSALFRLPPEKAHELAISALGALPRPARRIMRKRPDPRLATNVFGVDFPNPVGLAAGFDKGAAAYNGLGALGFGFVEIGTVTALAQPGNPQPRLFRIPEDQALVNRMGFNNPGSREVARRLGERPAEIVLGVNIGKSKVTELEKATEDYLQSLEILGPFADYLVVNVSSPNTPGLRQLQDAEPLRALLTAVIDAAVKPAGTAIPVLVKLAPDLTDPQLEEAVGIALETSCAGIIAVNTTISRDGLRGSHRTIDAIGAGGLSGAPLRVRAHQVLGRIHRLTEGSLPIIGVGGIMSAEDAWQRIRSGASLVQLYTGFVYHGPALIREINEGLVKRMERHGFKSISEVVGTVGA